MRFWGVRRGGMSHRRKEGEVLVVVVVKLDAARGGVLPREVVPSLEHLDLRRRKELGLLRLQQQQLEGQRPE